jgi:hypothetical protein
MKVEMTQVVEIMLEVETPTLLQAEMTLVVGMLVEMQTPSLVVTTPVEMLVVGMKPIHSRVEMKAETPEQKVEMLGQKVEMLALMQEPKVVTMPVANQHPIQQSIMTHKAIQSPSTTST